MAQSKQRKLSPFRASMVLAALAVIAVAVVLASQPSSGSVQAATPLLGKPAPAVGGSYLLGKRLSSLEFKGRWTVVSFFSSWCVECRIEAPQLEQFFMAHPQGSSAQIVMVDFEDHANLARQFLRLNGLTMPAVIDTTGKVSLNWGVRAPPETFVVAPNGDVVARFVGPIQFAQLQSLILGGKTS